MSQQQPNENASNEYMAWLNTKKELLALVSENDTVTVSATEYEQLKADAERYQWLKEQNADLDNDAFVVLAHDCTAEEQWQKYWVGSDLDVAIDQARKA